ncbi:MAG TPA: hypothetical protein VFR43_08030 [Gaiellaceae bacterium]|nr:hypothetical protein [Gaiellaceae bacterium]
MSATAAKRRAATALLLAAALGGTVTGAASGSGGTAASRCPVSKPTARPRPHFNLGTSRIAVALPPHATFVAVPEGQPGGAFRQANGWIRTKVGWWAASGAPRVTGRRIDGPARPLRADVGPLSHAVPGGDFYPSYLFFPSGGCWRLTAVSGAARLAAVVRVVEP